MGGDHADVLILGAGPSGGAAARRLVDAGFSVVCLEQGSWPDRGAYRGGELDWELTGLKQWAMDPNVREGPSDYSIDVTGSDYGILNFNGVGGATTLFNAVWPRFTPGNFRTRSEAGYGSDWPIGYQDLLPYYERTDREVGASGLAGNPLYPPGADYPLPPLPIRKGGLLMARAFTRLGWSWWPETNAILSAPYDGRNPCVQRGTCNQGCGEGAKGTADLTFWRHVVAGGGRVETGARVSQLVLDDSGLVAGAEWFDSAGQGHFQSADVVLCAANGVGTPRLLVASACSRFPDGLANGSGLLGRNLMLHAQSLIKGIFPDALESWQGHNGSWIASQHFYESDEDRGFLGTCKWAMHPTGGPLAQALPLGGAPVWGPDHHAHVAERLGHAVYMDLIGEDLPFDENTVGLSATETDAVGLPIPKVTYRMSEDSKRMLAWHAERAVEALKEAGATKCEVIPYVPMSAHLMGTARMGDDPATSVVDRFGLAHEISNLGIVDGSVFVTSGGVNPTSTIVALASRTADHLIQNRSQIRRAEPARSVFISRTLETASGQGHEERVEVAAFDDGERDRLSDFADLLIPGNESRPAPSEVGIAGRLLDQVIEARPDLAEPLHRALFESALSSPERLDELAIDDQEARMALDLAIAGGYYMSPEVRTAIGYPGQIAQVVSPDIYPDYVEEGLLESVLQMGQSNGTL